MQPRLGLRVDSASNSSNQLFGPFRVVGMAMASSTRLVTDSFPKTKKDRPINQKLKQSKAKDVIQKDQEESSKDEELNLEKDLLVLKEFDLDSEYGPCIGITRLERWERAEEYGLYPPREVKSIIEQHPNDTTFTECVWYNSNI